MTSRRDILIGSMCVLAAGAAYALKPRRLVTLMTPGKKLADILPTTFGDWSSRDVSDLVAPETPDSLSARLYGETVGKIFQHRSTGTQVIMLMAHGDVESNELQVHRPEVCYKAFGFSISESIPVSMKLANDVALPGRQLTARSSDRQETVLYWTRLGEYFPTDVTEQRLVRLRTAMDHYIPDGLLARFSVVGEDTEFASRTMKSFVRELISHVASLSRKTLIGTERANLFQGSN